MLRDTIDVFFQVAYFDEERAGKKKEANLAGAKVRAANTKGTVAIARELRERAERIREQRATWSSAVA